MTRTFLDAGVLIVAARDRAESAGIALSILDDEARRFVASPFLRLEVLPKAVYFSQSDEADFYREYFAAVSDWLQEIDAVVAEAESLASTFGLSAMDALHAAAAMALGADELITTEQPTKPIYRVTGLKVTWLLDLA